MNAKSYSYIVFRSLLWLYIILSGLFSGVVERIKTRWEYYYYLLQVNMFVYVYNVIYSRKASLRKSSDSLTLWSWASTSSRTRSMLCRFSLNIRHSKVISRGTFLASKARSVRSFSCCNKEISASVSSRHLFKSLLQLSMSCILFSSFVLLSCWVQRVWLSVSFLRKRLSCRTRWEESLWRSAFVLIIAFEVCQSDTAKRGGILGSVKAIFYVPLLKNFSKKPFLQGRPGLNEFTQ